MKGIICCDTSFPGQVVEQHAGHFPLHGREARSLRGRRDRPGGVRLRSANSCSLCVLKATPDDQDKRPHHHNDTKYNYVLHIGYLWVSSMKSQ
jgi:hypothetical protein